MHGKSYRKITVKNSNSLKKTTSIKKFHIANVILDTMVNHVGGICANVMRMTMITACSISVQGSQAMAFKPSVVESS